MKIILVKLLNWQTNIVVENKYFEAVGEEVETTEQAIEIIEQMRNAIDALSKEFRIEMGVEELEQSKIHPNCTLPDAPKHEQDFKNETKQNPIRRQR